MVCCVTGHRPAGFPFRCRKTSRSYRNYLHVLHEKVENLIEKGYHTFLTGMAQGVDLDFAETVLKYKRKLQKKHIRIVLQAVIPCPNQTRNWMPSQIRRYRKILKGCDAQTEISPFYHQRCMQDRNEYMVNCADLVLAVWNGEKLGGTWNTIRYAKRNMCKVEYILLHDLV